MKHERQVLIPGWKQDAIRQSSALVVGCGAIGSALGITLARLGVGSIALVDPDLLEEHNLENQAYDQSDLGKFKVRALARRISAIDPTIRVQDYVGRVQDLRPVEWPVFFFGCLDNVASRHHLSYLAIREGATLIDGGIEGFRGAVKTVIPRETACQACYPTLRDDGRRASCSSDPIPSTFITASVVSNFMAARFVRLVHGEAVRSHLAVDIAASRIHENDLQPNPKCEICGGLS